MTTADTQLPLLIHAVVEHKSTPDLRVALRVASSRPITRLHHTLQRLRRGLRLDRLRQGRHPDARGAGRQVPAAPRHLLTSPEPDKPDRQRQRQSGATSLQARAVLRHLASAGMMDGTVVPWHTAARNSNHSRYAMTVLTINDFADKQGDAFQMVVDDATSLGLTLTAVKAEKPCNHPNKTRDPFSLFFDGTKDVHCPQRIYRLRHASGWEVEMFLVPVGRNEDGMYKYQAVFN